MAATCRDILQKQVKSFIRIWQDVLLVFFRHMLLQDLVPNLLPFFMAETYRKIIYVTADGLIAD